MRLEALVLALIPCSALSAQGSFVTPSLFDTRAGNDVELYTCYRLLTSATPAHIQFVWDTADIPVTSAMLSGMDLRRTSAGTTNPSAQLTLSIELSVGPNSSAMATQVFGGNTGPAPIRVFDGTLQLPAEGGPTPTPAPWSVPILFTTPFPYVAAQGPGFVVDFRVTNYSPTVNTVWGLDARSADLDGSRASNGTSPNCRFSSGSYNNSLSAIRRPTVGGSWTVTYSSQIPNVPGIGFLGDLGPGDQWNGVPLPLDLGPLGASGCYLRTNLVLMVPLQFSTTWPILPIPNDRRLLGAVFYDQAIWAEPAANALGLVVSWSSKWTIGDTNPPLGAKVYQLFDFQSSPTGTLMAQALIARFHY